MGRIKAYIKDMTWFGHSEEDGQYKLGMAEDSYASWHAQDLWIQPGYSYGIPAGVLLVVLTIALLIFYRPATFRDIL